MSLILSEEPNLAGKFLVNDYEDGLCSFLIFSHNHEGVLVFFTHPDPIQNEYYEGYGCFPWKEVFLDHWQVLDDPAKYVSRLNW